MNRLADASSNFELPLHYPGARDQAYCRRRQELYRLALHTRLSGMRELPEVRYTAGENRLWAELYKTFDRLHHEHADATYMLGKSQINFNPERIPSLPDLCKTLGGLSSVDVVPAEGLLPLRAFFAHLSASSMPITLFLRHRSPVGTKLRRRRTCPAPASTRRVPATRPHILATTRP